MEACQCTPHGRMYDPTGLCQIVFNRCWLTCCSTAWQFWRWRLWVIFAGCTFARSARSENFNRIASAIVVIIGVTSKCCSGGAGVMTAFAGVISGWTSAWSWLNLVPVRLLSGWLVAFASHGVPHPHTCQGMGRPDFLLSPLALPVEGPLLDRVKVTDEQDDQE